MICLIQFQLNAFHTILSSVYVALLVNSLSFFPSGYSIDELKMLTLTGIDALIGG